MLKVLKFGGSSMADAHQFAKVKAIVDSDPSRRVVVVSAAGKRSRDDHKLTDLLYLCYAHLQYGVSCDAVFDMIRSRYLSIRDELHLSTPLEAEFAALREKMDRGISQDELVSRGEYFAARLMADYLGYDFLDSTCWLRFRLDGTVDQPASYEALRRTASSRRVVIPGFYGAMPDGSVKTFTRGGSDITGALAAAALDADVYRTPLPFPAVFAVSAAFSVIPSFFCRIYVFILHSLYKENAGTNQPLCPCVLPVMDIRRKDDELPSLDIVFFQLILQAGAWDPQPGRCVHDLPVAGLHGR